jgi:conjugal transfer pilin signal peptidase TrbI
MFDTIVTKRVAGMAGDHVAVSPARMVTVNGQLIGRAKPKSMRGVPLEPIEAGTIPPGFIFAAAPHPDSLDSRYKVTGLVGPDRILGAAHVLF